MSTYFAHPTALVESDQIGDGTRVWAFCHILSGAVIGENCNIGDHCFVEGGARVGCNATIKNGVAVWDGVSIGDGVFVGPSVVFTNDRRPRSPRLPEAHDRYSRSDWLTPTRIARGATLGAGAIIVAGVTIGEYAFVGAGAVVTRDVAPHTAVVGTPARCVGYVCRCGSALDIQDDQATCDDCGFLLVAPDRPSGAPAM